eukprot:TRINITY_DN31595_c0_g1_i1.p1 TRINITY_DN31595_c0_g1~~TRINITY_DN31595_c0_g1_i1.p1  ORF type:complete len:220 (+),score=12.92 TRINITY_DN31595_c0_g1_i1:52-711(+)
MGTHIKKPMAKSELWYKLGQKAAIGIALGGLIQMYFRSKEVALMKGSGGLVEWGPPLRTTVLREVDGAMEQNGRWRAAVHGHTIGLPVTVGKYTNSDLLQIIESEGQLVSDRWELLSSTKDTIIGKRALYKSTSSPGCYKSITAKRVSNQAIFEQVYIFDDTNPHVLSSYSKPYLAFSRTASKIELGTAAFKLNINENATFLDEFFIGRCLKSALASFA